MQTLLSAPGEAIPAGRPVDGSVDTVPLDDLLVRISATAVLVCCCWLAAVTVLVAAGRCGHRAGCLRSAAVCGTLARRIAPPMVLRLSAVLLGTGAVAFTAVPVGADTGLDGLAMPDRTTGGLGASDAPTCVRVRSGDSLWRIAETLLPATAPARAVDRTWRAIYRANRERIGSDPDLILPRTVLRIPPLADPPRKERP